ncbi:MAG: beta-glucosidase, partial [Bacteroidetes bacterium]|nr:beta-glucosidase [Bacteroidota bacterium]
MKNTKYSPALLLMLLISACGKSKGPTPPAPPASFSMNTLKVNGIYNGYTYKGLNTKPTVKISFSSALDPNSVSGSVTF